LPWLGTSKMPFDGLWTFDNRVPLILSASQIVKLSRRQFLVASALAGSRAVAGASLSIAEGSQSPGTQRSKALVAITLDLEMARNFPHREDTHGEYEKGNLNAEAKRYAVEAVRRCKARGVMIPFFAAGQVLEQQAA